MLGPGEEDYFMDSVPAGQEPYDPNYFSSTEDFLSGIKSDNVLAGSDYMQGGSKFKRQNIPFTALGAGQMVYSSLMENHFVKGVKNNPEKYLGNPKYIKNAAGYFSKQGSKQFGSNFKEYPEAAIMVAEANQALYDYLQSTEAGRKRAVELGLNENAINEQTAKASSNKLEAQKRARSYSAFQDGEINSKEDVAAKKLAYASMSQKDLDNTDAAGSGQYEGMAIGGNKVYVDISDGMVSGTKFKSGTIFVKWKKEEREKRAKEETQKAKEEKQQPPQQPQQQPQQQRERQQDSNTDSSSPTYTQDNYEQASGTGSSGSSKGSGPSRSQQRVSKPSSTPRYGPRAQDRKLGGRVTLQEGDSVPMGNPMGNPMGQQQPLQDAGNLELVQEQGKDMSGVADDVPRELAEGDFVINAPAMEMAGRGDVEQMIKKAVTELQSKGVKLDFGQEAEDIDSTVQALVSNKEMIIPKIIAEQIGYDRLEKINNRGKKRVEEIEQEQGQQQVQQNPTQPNPLQGMMAVGGQVSLDENKNQPIAVPQESFAGQSSVGSKLLSPMSPEAQDDEKELANRSQSFEGFMKPVKLAEGGKIFNNPGNIEANTSASGVNINETYSKGKTYTDGSGRFAVFNSKEDGLAAIPYTLSLPQYSNNVAEMVNTYKPPTENSKDEIQNTIDHIVKNLGKDTFDLTNQEDVYALIQGITQFDSGVDSLKYYTPEAMKAATDMFLKSVTTQNVQPNETNKIIPKPKPDMMPIQQQTPAVQQQGMMGR